MKHSPISSASHHSTLRLLFRFAAVLVLPACGLGDAAEFSAVSQVELRLSATGATSASPQQPVPEMGIGVPAHGAALYDNATVTSPWYDPVNDRVTVGGSIADVPVSLINSGNMQVLLDGQYAATIVSADPATQVVVFRGSTDAWESPEWVQRSVLAELVNMGTRTVVARATNTYFDLRREANTQLDADPGKRPRLSLQLTDSGVGEVLVSSGRAALEVPLMGALPYPNRSSFNLSLADAARGAPHYDDDEAELDTCIGLGEVDGRFRTHPAYLEAVAQAVAYYAVYEAYQQGGEAACLTAASTLSAAFPPAGLVAGLLCASAMNGWCVQGLPELADFELCVNQLEGDSSSLTTDAVNDVQLRWDDSEPGEALLSSEYGVSGISGTVTGLLRDMSIRWIDEGAHDCLSRPVAGIADSSLAQGDWLEDFATCRDIAVTAREATTTDDAGNPAQFAVGPHAYSKEEVELTQTKAGRMVFVNPEVDAERGMCQEPFLLDHATAMAETFQGHFEDALNEAWNDGATRTHEALALEELLGTLELGQLNLPDYEFRAELLSLGSEPAGGAKFSWSTQIEPLIQVNRARRSAGMFFSPALPSQEFETGRNHRNEAFGISYTVTTGFLNQVLHAKAGSDLLHFVYQPSWDELAPFGATAASTGHPGDEPPPIDGTVLSYIDPSFAALGSTRLEIRIAPTLDPVAWMNPDPPQALLDPVTGAPLAVGIGGLEVSFVEPDEPQTGAEKVWLKLQFAGRDSDFSLQFPAEGDSLIPSYQNDAWGVAVESTLFAGCPKVPHGVWEPPASCERTLELALLALFEPLVKQRLLTMLQSTVPAPAVWDVGEEEALTSGLAPFLMNQNIVFFRNIDD